MCNGFEVGNDMIFNAICLQYIDIKYDI